MLYCPFCGAEIIIPDQDGFDDADAAPSEPVTVPPVFSFDIPDEPDDDPEPEPQAAEPETRLDWDAPDETKAREAQPTPEVPPVAEAHEALAPEPAEAVAADVIPGRRTEETLVPDKASSMFMDDADDFDDVDDFDEEDSDPFDDFEEAVEREARRRKRAKPRAPRYRDNDPEEDELERGFISRHIRGIVGILLFLILLAVLALYALSDSGQSALARINATLPLKAEVYSRIAFDYYQSGDYAQSGVYYERALAREADSYNYASSAAMAYIAGGNNDKAAEMLRKCIQLKPEAVEPYVYLLNLYPNAASRPWDVSQLLKQGYELTGDARLEGAGDGAAQS